jgi:hypothetical protein
MARKKKKEMDKLSWENAQALACGMSYGKWKAMQEPVKIVPKTDWPEGWRRCEWCGQMYKPKTKRPQKFCEVACQIQARDTRRKKENREYMREYRARKKAVANEA